MPCKKAYLSPVKNLTRQSSCMHRFPVPSMSMILRSMRNCRAASLISDEFLESIQLLSIVFINSDETGSITTGFLSNPSSVPSIPAYRKTQTQYKKKAKKKIKHNVYTLVISRKDRNFVRRKKIRPHWVAG